MSILSGGQADFFGLDVGTASVRAVELKGRGDTRTLARYGQISTGSNVVKSDATIDQQRLHSSIKELLKQTGITTKNVAVNIPSQQVFTTVIDIDKMSQAELAKTVGYQAGTFIPTPINESKVDWVILGDSPKEANKVEVLLSSVSNSYAEARLDMLEAAGLNVIAIEPDHIALCRSLLLPSVNEPQMVLDIGQGSTDLVISMNGAPRLARAISVGTTTIVQAAMHSMSIDQDQAEQFVFKFGLGKDKLEGRIYNAIIGTIDGLMSEIDKSIKFFQGRYETSRIARIVVTGGAAIMPELPLYIADKFSLSVEIGDAWRNVSFPANKQNELLAVSNHFAVACGLAERNV